MLIDSYLTKWLALKGSFIFVENITTAFSWHELIKLFLFPHRLTFVLATGSLTGRPCQSWINFLKPSVSWLSTESQSTAHTPLTSRYFQFHFPKQNIYFCIHNLSQCCCVTNNIFSKEVQTAMSWSENRITCLMNPNFICELQMIATIYQLTF